MNILSNSDSFSPSGFPLKETISQSAKNKDNKRWYKEKMDQIEKRSYLATTSNIDSPGNISRLQNKKENYDLFNNIINVNNFSHITAPWENAGSMPAELVNRDIVSAKIKVLLGMEYDMPFSYKVAAVNEEATTRREQEEFRRIREYVVSSIMVPIQQNIESQYQQQINGRQLTPDESNQLQSQIQQQIQSETPEEVFQYMRRDHQDPAERLMQQLLDYIWKKEKLREKFNRMWKHATIGGTEIAWVGIINDEPVVRVVNDLRFDYDRTSETGMIQDGEWAIYENRLTPTAILRDFGSELTNSEIDRIFDAYNNPAAVMNREFNFKESLEPEDAYNIPVIHYNWIGLRKIGFLKYFDIFTGRIETMFVPETYVFRKEIGDLQITWEWIPEEHEGYKIALPEPIYVRMRAVPGQHKDMDNLYNSKLSYFGTSIDDMNSLPTSPMDRMKQYQIYYDIILYRLDMLVASDKGKMLLININMIPKSSGIDTAKWMYFMEANKIAFFDPNEEGNKLVDSSAGSVAKELDMNLASDIEKYIRLAEYIERRCGEAVGITQQMQGLINPNEAVTNARQNLTQSSYILRPYFELHNTVKLDIMQAVVEKARVAYSRGKQRKLFYILDDMSKAIIDIDPELLDATTYGLFAENAIDAYDSKQMVINLAQAQLQTQRADVSDILKIMNSNSTKEGQEMLEAAEDRADQRIQQQKQQELQFQERQSAIQREQEILKFNQDKELIIIKEEERRKTELQKQAMLSFGFNEDKDLDKDGVPDVLEIYKAGVKAQIDATKVALDAEKLAHQKDVDKKKLEQVDKKLKIDEKKANQKPKSK